MAESHRPVRVPVPALRSNLMPTMTFLGDSGTVPAFRFVFEAGRAGILVDCGRLVGPGKFGKTKGATLYV